MISDGPKITKDGLVLCLDAANTKSYPGSGNTWYDLSGNGYHMTWNGNQSFVSNYGGYFNLASYSVATVNLNVSSFPGLTFCTWMFIGGVSSAYFGHSFGLGATLACLSIPGITNVYNATLFSSTKTYNSLPLSLGWSYIVSTYQLNNAVTSYGFNGTTNYSSTISNPDTSFPSTTTFDIVSQVGYIGDIATTNLYNKVLTYDQITQNFESQRKRYGI